MCLSSMDLRIVMRVLDVVGKMGATKVVKRRAALEVMAREDVSDVALEALMDDHALNGSNTPRRALRSRLLSRAAHHAHDGPPQVTGSHEAGGAGEILIGAGPIPSRAGAPPDIGGAHPSDPATLGDGLGPCGDGTRPDPVGDSVARADGARPSAVDSPPGVFRRFSVGSPTNSSTLGVNAHPSPAVQQCAGSRRPSSGPPEGATVANDSPSPVASRSRPPSIRGRRAAASPGSSSRSPEFTANDCARLFHVMVDRQCRSAVERANLPLTRTELDRAHAGLWTTTLAPLYNSASYLPTLAKLVDGVMEDDVRGIDPCRHSGPRDASKLETQYRAMRSAYTVAVEHHKGTGRNAPGELKNFVGGDSRLLYIHCLLYGTPVMGYVLRTIPSSAQCELGLRGSPAVGAPGQRRAKRAKVAEVAIQGMEALTTALTTALGPTVGSAATDIHDNAQALGAVMEQVRAARRDVADNPDDPTSGIVLKHLLSQVAKLTAPDP